MIFHPNLFQDDGGAAHRVNFDTPPLRGRCRAPWALLVYRLESATLTG